MVIRLIAALASGYASDLTCKQQLEVDGSAIMSQTPVSSSKSLVISRSDGRVLSDGDDYSPGETLAVSLALPSLSQAHFRASSGAFSGGESCAAQTALPSPLGTSNSSTSSTSKSSTAAIAFLLAPGPDSEEKDVQIWAGHASGYGRVSVTSKRILRRRLSASKSQEVPSSPPPSQLTVPSAARPPWPWPSSPPPILSPLSTGPLMTTSPSVTTPLVTTPTPWARPPPSQPDLSSKSADANSFRRGALSVSWDSASNVSAVSFALRVDKDAYVGLGVSIDGRMGGSPALIATCRAQSSTSGCDARHYILEYDFPREANLERAGGAAPQDAPQDTFSSAVVSREDSSLGVSFTLPYTESCGSGQLAICVGQATKLILAHGPDSFDLRRVHGTADSHVVAVEIAPNQVSRASALDVPIEAKYVAHGACMAVSWLVLAPLAVAAARYLKPCDDAAAHRPQAPGPPLWLRAHLWLQLSALALSVTGVGLAISMVEGGRHFHSTHATLGISLFAITCAQVTSGLIRPRKASHAGIDENSLHPNAARLRMDVLRRTKRTVWQWLHRMLGWGLIALGFATVVYGAGQLKAHIDRAGGNGIVVSIHTHPDPHLHTAQHYYNYYIS